MKISPEQIEALKLQQQQLDNKAKKVDGAAFGEFLNQEVQQGSARKTATPPPVPGLHAMNPLLQVQQVAQVQPAQVSESEFVGKVEQIFGQLDSYAQQLGSSSEGGLKQAYNTLEGIQGGVDSLKKDWPGVASENPELGAIVGELEVMAVTEQIKFNRGDYV
ncbi:hypothetical protein [Maridesulfovibrio hydrothermalis]|uniref:Uncharacterized protein n=1 Tax=Maridesulfovibrio hydrothermalis AM13 = DSM 14728 TaxID=1121451 RepID=L0R9D9_9BACT|nr:hypothetical protein [Maridesulfovibrio hydrothermalis]CCO22810.1 conserved protein of unknown function [Maridesulfovibrio hydrothermalis AM13 = DSM 14728]